MDTIKQWILAICVSAVVGGIVLILSPKGSTEKAVRTAVSLVILCIILAPFTSGIEIDLPEETTENYEEELKSNTIDVFKDTIKEKIEKILNDNGVKFKDISIDITTENNELIISSVKIVTFGDNTSTIKEQIRRELGIEVEIEVQNEDNY